MKPQKIQWQKLYKMEELKKWFQNNTDISGTKLTEVLDYLKGKDVGPEEWRPVVDHEDSYEVSNRGRVRSKTRTVVKKGAPKRLRKCTYKGRVLSIQEHTNGYKFIALRNNGKTKQHRIHRLVAKAFIPNPDNKPEVNHDLGIKAFNWAINLHWATKSENHKHAHKKGLGNESGVPGSANGRAKITEDDVRYIRKNPDDLTQPELGEKFGLHHSTIQKINVGKLWPHVEIANQ